MAQWLTNPTRNQGIPGLAQWVKDWRCHELWCRSQTQLRSHIAVALAKAGSYSLDSTPCLEISICHGNGPRKGKKTKIK